ncbi:MAG TPA: CbtB domain-containing protein [Methylocella sp.]|nr:CbtB domain-containing protein [Methylocella sp.]
MNAKTLDQSVADAAPVARAESLKAAFVGFFFGCMLIYAMGFAHPSLLHNVAHDWRHSMNFPCH